MPRAWLLQHTLAERASTCACVRCAPVLVVLRVERALRVLWACLTASPRATVVVVEAVVQRARHESLQVQVGAGVSDALGRQRLSARDAAAPDAIEHPAPETDRTTGLLPNDEFSSAPR